MDISDRLFTVYRKIRVNLNQEEKDELFEIFKLICDLEKKTKENVNDFTVEEMIKAIEYGFWYAENSQHSGNIPVGNSLQWIMGNRKLLDIPEEWKNFLKK